MTDPPADVVSHPLPPLPAPTASYSERDYYRRRIDELLDERVQSIANTVGVLDERVDAIDSKLSRIFGGLAVIVVLTSLFGPAVVHWVTGAP